MKNCVWFLTLIFSTCTISLFSQVPVIEIPKPATFSIQLPSITSKQKPVVNSQQQFAPLYNNSLSITEKNRLMVEQDMKNYYDQKKRKQAVVDEAVAEMSKDDIKYYLTSKPLEGKQLFYQAYEELSKMLKGETALDIRTAVFLAEHPFDRSFNWQQYNEQIQEISMHIHYMMQEKGISNNDHVAKNLTLFEFFSDTVTIKHPGKESPITTYPMFYDFEDFWGRKDPTKVFVSKLLRTGTGQCHSLPLLYLILAEQLNIKAHLAFSANHSYIKFQDRYGKWMNIELTNRMLTSDNYIIQSGFINATALKSRIYLQPLTKREVIAQGVNDLASGYMKKYGYDEFVLQCTNLALEYLPNSIKAHQLQEMYYGELTSFIIDQYKNQGLTQEDFENDPKAMRTYRNVVEAQQKVDSLGWMEMPQDTYEKWLRSVNEEANKQEHRNRLRTITGQIGK